MHDIELYLSTSLKYKVNGAIRKPTHDFLSVNNYNKCLSAFSPHKVPLYEKIQSAVKSERTIQAQSNLVTC